MITVLFFAKYREQLGVSCMNVQITSALTVSDLKQQLISDGGADWATVLLAENTLCAVNQTLAKADDLVTDGDEVAFYPPVTGG